MTTPTGAAAEPSPAPPADKSGDVDALKDHIAAQGSKVRDLKSSGADKVSLILN